MKEWFSKIYKKSGGLQKLLLYVLALYLPFFTVDSVRQTENGIEGILVIIGGLFGMWFIGLLLGWWKLEK